MGSNQSLPLRAVSLFSNCGAGDIGFAQAGFKFDVMAELESRRLEIALLNHPGAIGVPGDLRDTLENVIEAYKSRWHETPPALLAACPPCQGMSSARSARGFANDPDAGSLDRRNLLVEVVAKAVHQLRPRILVVENVQAFLIRQLRHPVTKAPISAANYLIDALAGTYTPYPLVADLADFGVPQSRKRCFITFIKNDETVLDFLQREVRAPYPKPSHGSNSKPAITLADALRSLELPSLDSYSKDAATSDVPLHIVPVWPSEIYQMIDAIPPYSALSAWDNNICLKCSKLCLDRERARCDCGAILPRPVVRDKDGTVRLVTGFHSSYRRMDPKIPASTVTTASGHVGSDRTIHPWENRVLSPLECARLQTFPSTFKWGDALARWGHTNVRAMIGEAVPPLFTRRHGRVLLALLSGHVPRNAMEVGDRRIVNADAALKRARLATNKQE